MQAARQGDRARATELFHAALEQDPDHEEALLWLAALTEDPGQSIAYLQRVLDINPHNARAQAGLRWAEERRRPPEALSEAPIQPAPAWGGTVDLVPLEPERTRWQLSTVVGLAGALLLIGALIWWALSSFPLVRLSGPEATATAPRPTSARPPSPATAIATHTPSPLPPTATATVPAVIAMHTPTSSLPTETETVPTAAATNTPTFPLPTATAAVLAATGTYTPTPLPPTATTIVVADTATATALPSAAPSAMPTLATAWPTPGPTTDPHVTPAPTEPSLPGRG